MSSRRLTKLIDQEVQGGLLRKVITHWGLLYLANTIALFVWLSLFELHDATWSELFGAAIERYFPVIVVSIALLPAFLWDTIRLTNRFAGPIRRLRSALANAARGEKVEPLHFRTNDYWREIASDFNTLTGTKSSQEATP